MAANIAKTQPNKILLFGGWIAHHWFGVFLVIYGLWVFTPFLAPLFMYLGWAGLGKSI